MRIGGSTRADPHVIDGHGLRQRRIIDMRASRGHRGVDDQELRRRRHRCGDCARRCSVDVPDESAGRPDQVVDMPIPADVARGRRAPVAALVVMNGLVDVRQGAKDFGDINFVRTRIRPVTTPEII